MGFEKFADVRRCNFAADRLDSSLTLRMTKR